MLQRHKAANGVVVYISPLLREMRVPHAFSTRLGGRSPAPFDSLNLGNPNGCAVQDDYERIWENYRLLQEAAGCEDRELCRVHQVHGHLAVTIEAKRAADPSVKADALVTDDPARALSVRVADCVPVLMSGPGGRAVAAVHAGWRGVVAGVAPAALRTLCTRGDFRPEHVTVAIGPSIGFDAFEVGPEVLDAFAAKFGADGPFRRRPDKKGHVDLREAIRRQLVAAAVPEDRIDSTDRCTVTHRDEFFSHRRDDGITGRMAAVIATVV